MKDSRVRLSFVLGVVFVLGAIALLVDADARSIPAAQALRHRVLTQSSDPLVLSFWV